MEYSHIYGFEKLKVWQLSRKLVVEVYKITNVFPDEEKFGISNQIRRSAISIPANISEGSGRKSSKDQAHFYQMAYSSLLELINHLIISNDLGYLSLDELNKLKSSISEISFLLNKLQKSKQISPT